MPDEEVLLHAISQSVQRARANGGDYPENVESVIDDEIAYRRGVIPALKQFKKHIKTHRLSKHDSPEIILRRFNAMRTLVQVLSIIYQKPVPEVRLGVITGEPGSSGSSCYIPAMHTIVLNGRLSVLTLLHEFAHALGKDEKAACKWSLNLFKKVYPRQFRRLMQANGGGEDSHFLAAGAANNNEGRGA